MNAKGKLKEQIEYTKIICEQNMMTIESAASIGYANNAIAGNTRYPLKIEILSRGLLPAFPQCPSGGTSICVFRSKVATYSGESCRSFRLKVATNFG
jgi:hypothetical protein